MSTQLNMTTEEKDDPNEMWSEIKGLLRDIAAEENYDEHVAGDDGCECDGCMCRMVAADVLRDLANHLEKGGEAPALRKLRRR